MDVYIYVCICMHICMYVCMYAEQKNSVEKNDNIKSKRVWLRSALFCLVVLSVIHELYTHAPLKCAGSDAMSCIHADT